MYHPSNIDTKHDGFQKVSTYLAIWGIHVSFRGCMPNINMCMLGNLELVRDFRYPAPPFQAPASHILLHPRSLTARPWKWWQRKTFAFPIGALCNFSGAKKKTSGGYTSWFQYVSIKPIVKRILLFKKVPRLDILTHALLSPTPGHQHQKQLRMQLAALL